MFDSEIQACLVFNKKNRQYFTKASTSSGCVVLTPEKNYFLTDSRYTLYARNNIQGFEVVEVSANDMYDKIYSILTENNINSVGIEEDFLTLAEFAMLKKKLPKIKFNNVSQLIAEMRMIKSSEEIDLIRKSLEVTQNAFKRLTSFIKVGVTERELAAELVFEIIKNGAEDYAFSSMVAFGANSAMPHYSPQSQRLEKNEIVLIDAGSVVNGYNSDISRVYAIGEIDERLMKVYKIVLEAQEYALKSIKPYMSAHEADSFAREYIIANGYGNMFNHSLGHGLGLDIHEAPRITRDSDIILKPNMVITIEPGIYLEGIGGVRIEDTVLITENGIENLTTLSKELRV